MNIINRQHKQNGATLLFALVLLLLMTVLGLSSIRGVSLQERMASNLNERDLAFQAAEAALLAAEKEILLNPEPFGMVDCTSTSILNCATIPSNTFTASNVDWMNVPDDYAINKSKELGTAQFHIQLIGKSAFENCTSLENFVLPEFVRKIESSTFSNCRNLKNITIHKDAYLDTIDSHAFKDCVSLEQFICPDFVSSLGQSVFYGCINLKEIHLPKALLCLGDYAFYQCDQVNSKNISKEILNLMKKSKGNPDWAEEVNYA